MFPEQRHLPSIRWAGVAGANGSMPGSRLAQPDGGRALCAQVPSSPPPAPAAEEFPPFAPKEGDDTARSSDDEHPVWGTSYMDKQQEVLLQKFESLLLRHEHRLNTSLDNWARRYSGPKSKMSHAARSPPGPSDLEDSPVGAPLCTMPDEEASRMGPKCGSTPSEVMKKRAQFRKVSYTEDDLSKKLQACKHSKSETFSDFSEQDRLGNRLQKIMASTPFELGLAGVIIINSGVIGWQVEYEARHLNDNPWIVFYIVNLAFTVGFALELCARILAERLRFITGPNYLWNAVDVTMVVFSVLEVFAETFILVSSSGSAALGGISNVRIIRVLRVSRCVRTLRMARLIRVVASLRTLVASIVATLKSLMWALLLLLMIIYVVSIVIVQGITQHVISGGPPVDFEAFWGTVPSAMYTLFQSISGGISWNEVVAPLEHIHVALVAVFTVYIFFTYFAVLNVLTGVFCQSAIETVGQDPDLASQAVMQGRRLYLKKLRRLFRRLDSTSDGVITLGQLEGRLADEHLGAYLAAMGVDAQDAWSFFKLMDSDGNHTVDVDEFVEGIMRLKGNAKGLDMQTMMADQRWIVRNLANFMNSVNTRLAALVDSERQVSMDTEARVENSSSKSDTS